MSGSSSAFKDAGYVFPKNLIDIGGIPLVQHVFERLQSINKIASRFICVLRRDENIKHHIAAVVNLLDKDALIVELGGETSGAACSALLAVDHINNDDPLVIVNGDIVIDCDLVSIVQDFKGRELDGGIVVFGDLHPRWSFIKCDDSGLVVEAAEKRPISKLATAGFYYYARGSDFVVAATEMIKKGANVDGGFYICPTYNQLILRQRKIGIYEIPRYKYHSLATPADVLTYNQNLSRINITRNEYGST